MDRGLSDGVLRTAELLAVLGKAVVGKTQEEIAEMRGISSRQLRAHLKELNRRETSGPINTYKRTPWVTAKRLGGIDIQAELSAGRTQAKVLGWEDRCAREGVDPYE